MHVWLTKYNLKPSGMLSGSLLLGQWVSNLPYSCLEVMEPCTAVSLSGSSGCFHLELCMILCNSRWLCQREFVWRGSQFQVLDQSSMFWHTTVKKIQAPWMTHVLSLWLLYSPVGWIYSSLKELVNFFNDILISVFISHKITILTCI